MEPDTSLFSRLFRPRNRPGIVLRNQSRVPSAGDPNLRPEINNRQNSLPALYLPDTPLSNEVEKPALSSEVDKAKNRLLLRETLSNFTPYSELERQIKALEGEYNLAALTSDQMEDLAARSLEGKLNPKSVAMFLDKSNTPAEISTAINQALNNRLARSQARVNLDVGVIDVARALPLLRRYGNDEAVDAIAIYTNRFKSGPDLEFLYNYEQRDVFLDAISAVKSIHAYDVLISLANKTTHPDLRRAHSSVMWRLKDQTLIKPCLKKIAAAAGVEDWVTDEVAAMAASSDRSVFYLRDLATLPRQQLNDLKDIVGIGNAGKLLSEPEVLARLCSGLGHDQISLAYALLSSWPGQSSTDILHLYQLTKIFADSSKTESALRTLGPEVCRMLLRKEYCPSDGSVDPCENPYLQPTQLEAILTALSRDSEEKYKLLTSHLSPEIIRQVCEQGQMVEVFNNTDAQVWDFLNTYTSEPVRHCFMQHPKLLANLKTALHEGRLSPSSSRLPISEISQIFPAGEKINSDTIDQAIKACEQISRIDDQTYSRLCTLFTPEQRTRFYNLRNSLTGSTERSKLELALDYISLPYWDNFKGHRFSDSWINWLELMENSQLEDIVRVAEVHPEVLLYNELIPLSSLRALNTLVLRLNQGLTPQEINQLMLNLAVGRIASQIDVSELKSRTLPEVTSAKLDQYSNLSHRQRRLLLKEAQASIDSQTLNQLVAETRKKSGIFSFFTDYDRQLITTYLSRQALELVEKMDTAELINREIERLQQAIRLAGPGADTPFVKAGYLLSNPDKISEKINKAARNKLAKLKVNPVSPQTIDQLVEFESEKFENKLLHWHSWSRETTLSPTDKYLPNFGFEIEVGELSRDMADYTVTPQVGIQKGLDTEWEFAPGPYHDYRTAAQVAYLLEKGGYLGLRQKYGLSLHVTLGGLDAADARPLMHIAEAAGWGSMPWIEESFRSKIDQVVRHTGPPVETIRQERNHNKGEIYGKDSNELAPETDKLAAEMRMFSVLSLTDNHRLFAALQKVGACLKSYHSNTAEASETPVDNYQTSLAELWVKFHQAADKGFTAWKVTDPDVAWDTASAFPLDIELVRAFPDISYREKGAHIKPGDGRVADPREIDGKTYTNLVEYIREVFRQTESEVDKILQSVERDYFADIANLPERQLTKPQAGENSLKLLELVHKYALMAPHLFTEAELKLEIEKADQTKDNYLLPANYLEFIRGIYYGLGKVGH